jgi:hypothetical protein
MDVAGQSPEAQAARDLLMQNKITFDEYMSTPGAYFRASIWSWPAIWEAAQAADPVTAAKVANPWTNDGDGLGAEDAKTLGEAILAMLNENAETNVWASTENVGTQYGDRILSQIPDLMQAVDKALEDKEPSSPVEILEPSGYAEGNVRYTSDSNHLREFAEFCIASGGFQIW